MRTYSIAMAASTVGIMTTHTKQRTRSTNYKGDIPLVVNWSLLFILPSICHPSVKMNRGGGERESKYQSVLHAGMMLRLLSCTVLISGTGTSTTPPGLAAASRTGTTDVSLECGLHAPLRNLGGSLLHTVDKDIGSATEVMIRIQCHCDCR